MKRLSSNLTVLVALCLFSTSIFAQGTRLLRQPTMSDSNIAFTYGGDIWITDLNGQNLKRITSTPAIESEPQFSPDGNWIAFSSNRSGNTAVYIVSKEGGTPKRLTWQPSAAIVRGWTPDGKRILYASSRETAPSGYNRLWTVPVEGGPSTMLSHQWGFDGSFSSNARQIAVDKMSRWDVEWRAYRGGQNTPLIILNLRDQSETLIPNEERTTDIHPLWMGNKVYFLSDRDWNMNVWSYDVRSKALSQVTQFTGTDVKSLNKGANGQLIIEQNGYLHTVDPSNGNTTQLNINVIGDFPWAETKWETVTNRASAVSLSATGKRVVMEARGEIFTVPTEFGDARNITQSSGAADRRPIWSPKGDKIAWFSDMDGQGYRLYLADQDGLSEPTSFSIGESKLGWEPKWSPDGKHIAFVDDDVRIRVMNMENGNLQTIGVGGTNLERGRSGLAWAPDSKKLAYTKAGENMFRKVMVWDSQTNTTSQLTNDFADAFAPSWDNDKKHFYFLASTNVALGSGWANTSSITASPSYSPYVIVLQEGVDSPFIPRSDEEEVKEEKPKKEDKPEAKGKEDKKEEAKEDAGIKIDFEGIDRRTIALPLPSGNYTTTAPGPAGSVFIAERKPGSFSQTLHKFTLKDRKAKDYLTGVGTFTLSADGKKMLARVNGRWAVSGTAGPSGKGGKPVRVSLKMKLNRAEEWKQMFEEAWRYERDYFYDPNMHGRDWNAVYDRYAPLIPFVKHRADLNYIFDMMNGELSVGHSFVGGGDYPSIDRSTMGMLGADLSINKNRWRIDRIYTTESWNPGLTSPLDRPGIKVAEGNYLVGVNGQELTAGQDPFELLDGTVGEQTVLHINDKPEFEGAWREVVEPIRSENALRQRAWVEDNRRRVDELSNGRLGYIWVPNTGGPGFVNFNRYFFAQQNKEGAVIDERFNGGGLLDDYMVDLMTRTVRAGLTNEVPNGQAMRLPAGILGPKVLLINELAGSGGDFFPWVFRQQKAGALIGARTWGGLVKSSTHYRFIDGGSMTAPDNAVFDPINNVFVAENEGVPADIEVRQDAKSLSNGGDPQLERAVQEVLRLLGNTPKAKITPPPYNTPAKKGN
ncbi:protease [Roseivirga sp. 4D4]|uniref:S41 family peptidase n=1 Tax=Roseivirga sp. 4D4 TaxID=1889784 RepID=UPI000853C821|nr:S41 family peptidase [Roseivirga sp. 4D4]OEK00869.1 protease [Roseivirga sp. 4D4]